MCVSCCLARLFVELSIKFYLGFLKREPGDNLTLQAKAKEMLILGFIAQENYPLNMVEMVFFFFWFKNFYKMCTRRSSIKEKLKTSP